MSSDPELQNATKCYAPERMPSSAPSRLRINEWLDELRSKQMRNTTGLMSLEYLEALSIALVALAFPVLTVAAALFA